MDTYQKLLEIQMPFLKKEERPSKPEIPAAKIIMGGSRKRTTAARSKAPNAAQIIVYH